MKKLIYSEVIHVHDCICHISDRIFHRKEPSYSFVKNVNVLCAVHALQMLPYWHVEYDISPKTLYILCLMLSKMLIQDPLATLIAFI